MLIECGTMPKFVNCQSHEVEPEEFREPISAEDLNEEHLQKKESTEELELKDPLDDIREKCQEEKISKELLIKYEKCSERVTSKPGTIETCVEEFLDFIEHRDHCVSHKIFKHLI